MSEAFNVYTIDSPRTVRNLRKLLTDRRVGLETHLRTAINWDHHNKIVGGLDELDGFLEMLDEIEKQERA